MTECIIQIFCYAFIKLWLFTEIIRFNTLPTLTIFETKKLSLFTSFYPRSYSGLQGYKYSCFELQMEQNMKSSEKLEVSVENESENSEETNKKVDCSHRVIEKRRRDRINNSLLQLSKLVPIEKFNKKNSGKLEKAEILEHTVHYLTELQFTKENENAASTEDETNQKQRNKECESPLDEMPNFFQGFKQCINDATKFFQDIEELDVSEGRCFRLIQHLKRQISRYENKERDLPPKNSIEERVVWDTEESNDVSNSRSSEDSSESKRKGGDLDGTPCKKKRQAPGSSDGEQLSSEQDCSSRDSTTSSTTSESSSNMNSNFLRNYTPFFLPNMPLFATMPFAGANNMPRFQSPQFPGYQYQQSPQYIPVAVSQFPVMGPMNFVPSFGMVNGEQSPNSRLPTSVASGLPMHGGVPNNGMPGMLPNGLPNGFFPSMYTDGLHANIMAMRKTDSGYDSEKSLSSKASGSEASSQSFSEESCRSNFS